MTEATPTDAMIAAAVAAVIQTVRIPALPRRPRPREVYLIASITHARVNFKRATKTLVSDVSKQIPLTGARGVQVARAWPPQTVWLWPRRRRLSRRPGCLPARNCL